MPNVVWDSETLTRLNSNAEADFHADYPCILDRLSIALVAGTAIYTIPDYVHSIKRITHKGLKLDPLTYRNQRNIFQGATQQSRPFWYVFNNVGQNSISLFPIPNVSLAIGTGDLWGPTAISNSLIVTFYRIPDQVNAVIPPYFRRRLLKLYISKFAFAQESRGQKNRNKDYFEQKWAAMKMLYGNLLDELHSKPRKLIVSGGIGGGYFPHSPILPIDKYGIGVDTGE